MSAAPVEQFEEFGQVEVEDLDPAGLLDLVTDAEAQIRRLEAVKLHAAAHWADLHPVVAGGEVETPGGPALAVLESPESLGGDGTPAVAAFTPEPFAAALGLYRPPAPS